MESYPQQPGAADASAADSDQPVAAPDDVEYFTQAQAGAWGEMLAAFARFVALPAGASVCDVGAGPGLLPRLFAAADSRLAVGCDRSWEMAARAAALAQAAGPTSALHWLMADARCLPFRSATFDGVVATNLLFLLPDPAVGLCEMCRVARPAGIVAFLNPTDAMSVANAAAFMDGRRIIGFARYSFVNYARLAEAHHRLSLSAWAELAAAAGLTGISMAARAGGMVGWVRGVRPA